MNIIHVFEVLDGKLGELWETIEWKQADLNPIKGGAEWNLNCNWVMPDVGGLGIVDPKDPNAECQIWEYKLPTMTVPGWKLGAAAEPPLSSKKEWEKLDPRVTLQWDLGTHQLALECEKAPLDPLYTSPHGSWYIYRPQILRLIAKNAVSADAQG
jgi:hypothetical protein